LARIGILTCQTACDEAGEVAVDFAGRHAASRREFSQRDWRLSTRQVVEDPTSDLDGLDASTTFASHPALISYRNAKRCGLQLRKSTKRLA